MQLKLTGDEMERTGCIRRVKDRTIKVPPIFAMQLFSLPGQTIDQSIESANKALEFIHADEKAAIRKAEGVK